MFLAVVKCFIGNHGKVFLRIIPFKNNPFQCIFRREMKMLRWLNKICWFRCLWHFERHVNPSCLILVPSQCPGATYIVFISWYRTGLLSLPLASDISLLGFSSSWHLQCLALAGGEVKWTHDLNFYQEGFSSRKPSLQAFSVLDISKTFLSNKALEKRHPSLLKNWPPAEDHWVQKCL